MDWQALIASFPNVTEISPGTAAYYRAMGIQAGVQAGASSNSIIRALQGQGLSFRRTQMLSNITTARARFSTGTTASQLAFDESGAAVLRGTPPAGWTGRYVHQVTVTSRTVNQDGDYVLRRTTFGPVELSVLTPKEAVTRTLAIIAEHTEAEMPGDSPSIGEVLSASLTGVWYQVRNV